MLRHPRHSSSEHPVFLSALGVLGLVSWVGGCGPTDQPEPGEPESVGQARMAITGGVEINEVESSGGVPGDWVEIYNSGTSTVDLSGWKLLDNDDAHTPYVIPSGTLIVAGGFVVLDEASFVFGLGA